MMKGLIHRLAVSTRLVRRSIAFACAATLLLGSSAQAGTILQFAQSNPADVVTGTNSGGGVTLLSSAGNADGGGTSIPVLASNYLGVPFPLGLPMFETYVGVTSTSAATSAAGSISQNYSGEIEFTSLPGGAGVVYLIATFGATGVFSGGAAGGSASLTASVPKDTVTFTVPGMSFSDAALSISYSGISPVLGITAGSVSSFTGQNSGTFSANTVPEPSTLYLGSFATVMGALAFARKRMKTPA